MHRAGVAQNMWTDAFAGDRRRFARGGRDMLFQDVFEAPAGHRLGPGVEEQFGRGAPCRRCARWTWSVGRSDRAGDRPTPTRASPLRRPDAAWLGLGYQTVCLDLARRAKPAVRPG